jgi:parallel beta-helix repeat protein
MLKLPIIVCIMLIICLWPVDGARTYIVGNDGVATHKSIGEAIAAASSGDTVYMKSGVYKEEVTMDKKIILKPLTGEKGTILLEGNGKETGIKITADGCFVEGLTLKNFTKAGIMIESNENTVKNNQFINDNPSIIIKGAAKNLIDGNTMKDCFAGVVLWLEANQNKITNNNIQGGSMSVFLRDVSGNIVIDNLFSGGSMGAYLMNASNVNVARNNIKDCIYGFVIYNSSDCNLTDNIESNNKRAAYLTNTTRTELYNQSIVGGIFGITAENSSNNIIRKCNIQDTKEAVGLRLSSGNVVSDNSIVNTTSTAISLEYSNGNSMAGNQIIRGDGGIIIMESFANRLEHNTLEDVAQALLVEGSRRQSFDNAIDESNTANGRPIAYFYGQSNEKIANRELAHLTLAYCKNFTIEKNIISNDALFLFSSDSNLILENNISKAYGILLLDSSANEISRNLLVGNKFSGIYLISSNLNNLSENTASDNSQNGVSLRNSSTNVVRSNIINKNNQSGIWLNESNGNQIFDNTIMFNPTGALLISSSNNQVYHNNFLNNTEQAEDSNGINAWDKGNTTGGNYWSDHLAIGNPSRGWSKVIKGSKMDNYPFQNQNGWISPSSAIMIPQKSANQSSIQNTTEPLISKDQSKEANTTLLNDTEMIGNQSVGNQTVPATKTIQISSALKSNQSMTSNSAAGEAKSQQGTRKEVFKI